jgi:hypothetical protein
VNPKEVTPDIIGIENFIDLHKYPILFGSPLFKLFFVELNLQNSLDVGFLKEKTPIQ